jgi:hypothetical protein
MAEVSKLREYILSQEKLSDVYDWRRCTYAVNIFSENKLMNAIDAFVDKYLPATDTFG